MKRAALVIVLAVAVASRVAAQDAVVGTYRARNVTLELAADGRATFFGLGGPLVIAAYRVVNDTITLHDENGPAACLEGSGRYLWRIDRDTLRFTVVSDPCERRRTSLSLSWARVSATSGHPAAELIAVVITAQRQSEDIQRAPVSVTALSASVLQNAGVTRPQDLTYLVPGLQVGSNLGSSALLYLRGVGNFAGNSLQDPTVTFNFDGVYIARQTATGGLYYDLERVEVLKGPQGTLYGRNATGGAVNILPRRPELHLFSTELAAEYGDFAALKMDAAVNAPVGDRSAFRFAGQRVRHGAYMSDGTDDQDDRAGRLSFRFDGDKSLAVRVVGDYYDQRGHGPGGTPIALGVDNRFGVTSTEGGAYYKTQRVTIAGRNFEPMPAVQRAGNRHSGVNATIDKDTHVGAITLVTAMRRSHLDASGTSSGNVATVNEHSRQNSVEARLASFPSSRLRTVGGLFYFDEAVRTRDGDFFRPYNQFNVSLQQPQSGVRSAAVFGRMTVNLTDRFRTTLGARYTHENKYFWGVFQSYNRLCPPVPTASCPNAQPFPPDITQSPLVFPPGSLTAVPFRNPVDGSLTTGFKIIPNEKATFSRTTWRAAVEYDAAETAFLYASYETGFKSGGFFFSNDPAVYRPETVGALTVGLKSRLWENRVQANVELFDWRYHDQQVSKLSLDSRGVTNLRTANVGYATIRGVETGIAYLASAYTQLSADIHYLSAIYDSYTFLTPTSSGPPLSGCKVASKADGFQVDCSGRHSPFAPQRTFALGAVQTLPLQSGHSIVARASARYQSETLTGLDFLPQQNQRAYWLMDASATFATANRFSIGVFGRNLTDRAVISNSFVAPFSTFPVGSLRPPRTFGIRVAKAQ